ncbi:MAG TPA: LysR family transcriptional regulator [Bradyrhizobium sp.]|nr:LysR family transcriptional regulator [Bradyrhizobium sp.]
MPKIADWDDQIGRRLRLRDLRVLFAVVQSGSFAKAAVELRVSQPAVSQVVSNLERALALQLPFWKASESMGNHDSEIVDAGSVD